MSSLESLKQRSHSQCELCRSKDDLGVFSVGPSSHADSAILICGKCKSQIEDPTQIDPTHWRSLSESMWSEFPAVQVMSYRMLLMLKNEPWAQDLKDQLFLDDSLIEWARAGLPEEEEIDTSAPTLDSNGTRLSEGDSVTLIKDLDVKGAGFTAKRGTLVKNISLTNNPKHIEGKVNGIQIVLVAAYLKKA